VGDRILRNSLTKVLRIAGLTRKFEVNPICNKFCDELQKTFQKRRDSDTYNNQIWVSVSAWKLNPGRLRHSCLLST